MTAPWEEFQSASSAGAAPAANSDWGGATGSWAAPEVAHAPGAGSEPPWLDYQRAAGGNVPPWVDYQRAQGTASSAPQEHASALQDAGRQIGLTLRALVAGAAQLPAMASDAVTGPINAGMDAVLGQGHGFRFEAAEHAINNLLTSAGVPEPKDKTERIVQAVAQGAASGLSPVTLGATLAKSGSALTSAIGEGLEAGPALQAVSGATGEGASQTVKEHGGGPAAQVAAGLAGGLAPGLVPFAGSAAIRGALRGGEEGRQAVQDSLDTFAAAGSSPTLGQATGGRFQQAAESLLAKTPGGAGVVAAKAQQQADEMSAAVQALSDQLAPDASATNAGEAITKGIGAFKDAFRKTQQRLYDQLDAFIPAGTRIPAENTQAALAELNADIPGAPALSKWFRNAKIAGIEGALNEDAQGTAAVLTRPGMADYVSDMRKNLTDLARRTEQQNAEKTALGIKDLDPVMTPTQIEDHIAGFLGTHVDDTLPYEGVKKLRTLVGQEISDGGLASDVPRSKWTALYAALSKDLGAAAEDAGPQAMQAWDRANRFTRLHMERLEQLSNVVGRQTPEKVFAAAMAGTSEGNTTIARVMKSLPTQERNVVAAAVLQRMGRATPGMQNAENDAFSTERFLTNLSKMSLPARQSIFGATSVRGVLAKVDTFATVADARRANSKAFANPSGTAAAGLQMANAGAVGSGVALAATGHPAALLGAVAAPTFAYGAAKVVTSPKVLRFAAGRSELFDGAKPAAAESVGRATGPTHGTPDLNDIVGAPSLESAMAAANRYVGGKSHQVERTPAGSLIVRGDTDSAREALSLLPPDVVVPTKEGLQVATAYSDRAQKLLSEFDPSAHAELNGKRVAIKVTAEDGTQGILKLDAGQALRATDARERELQRLLQCVKGGS